MSAIDFLRAGQPDEALVALKDQVRAEPAEAKHRIFLFQLLCVQGEWSKAAQQLEVAAQLDTGALAMVQTYREAIRCEVLRKEVFTGKRTPLVFGEPPAWIGLLIEALRLDGVGKHATASTIRSEAFENAEPTSGTVDGEPFEWIADADPRLGPVLETIVNGKYFWIPFEKITRIDLEAPEDLRDMVWMPAHFEWSNGGETVGLIPTRYEGSDRDEDSSIRMSRKTDWREVHGGLSVGYGQRILATQASDYPLLNVRRILLNTGATAGAASEGADG